MFDKNNGYLFYQSIKNDHSDWEINDRVLGNIKMSISVSLDYDNTLDSNSYTFYDTGRGYNRNMISPQFTFLERYFVKKGVKLFLKLREVDKEKSNVIKRRNVFLKLTKMSQL